MFLNKHREIRSGWALVLLIVVYLLITMIASFIVGMLVTPAALAEGNLNPERLQAMTSEITNSAFFNIVLYLGMIGGVLLLFYLLYKRPLSQLGLIAKGWLPGLLLGGVMGTVLIALAALVLIITGQASVSQMDFSRIASADFLSRLCFFILVGFFEEIMSRGFMMTALKTTRSKWVIILLPAVVFGLLHAMNPNVTVFSLANIAFVGLLFAYLFIKTGKLWAPIGLHIMWNFVQGTVFGIPVSGTTNFSLMTTNLTGADWFTGGAFGVEGGLMCTIVLLIGLAYVHFFVKTTDGPIWTVDSDMPLVRTPLAEPDQASFAQSLQDATSSENPQDSDPQ